MAEIVPLRTSPALTDVPGQLRQLADRIEQGELGEITSATFVVNNDRDGWPVVMGWGHTDEAQSAWDLQLALAYLVQNAVRR